MARQGLEHLAELLEGYCEPETKKWAVDGNAIGENGLTSRVYSVVYFNTIIQGMLQAGVYERRVQQFMNTYYSILQMTRISWATELLRIMDRPRTGQDENLTVSLFHERFQAATSIPSADRSEEDTLYNALNDKYESENYRRFRNKSWFHIDLAHNLQTPASERIGNINDMTMLLLDWYKFVGTYMFQMEPRYVTEGAAQFARNFLQEFRHMMVSARRTRRAAHNRRVATGL